MQSVLKQREGGSKGKVAKPLKISFGEFLTDVSVYIYEALRSLKVCLLVLAPALASFWSERYKVQVESRSGAIHLDHDSGMCNLTVRIVT